jgi:hypothetical protein
LNLNIVTITIQVGAVDAPIVSLGRLIIAMDAVISTTSGHNVAMKKLSVQLTKNSNLMVEAISPMSANNVTNSPSSTVIN